MREKLLPYTFTVKWVAGKEHHIADALSRAPLFAPVDLDDMYTDTARGGGGVPSTFCGGMRSQCHLSHTRQRYRSHV